MTYSNEFTIGSNRRALYSSTLYVWKLYVLERTSTISWLNYMKIRIKTEREYNELTYDILVKSEIIVLILVIHICF